MVARGRPREMRSGGIPSPSPSQHPRQGVGEGGASAERSAIGYRVAVRPRLANRI